MKKNKFEDKFSENYPWECIANHLPKWTEDPRLEELVSEIDNDRISGLVDRYNELIDKEETTDAHSMYGIDAEKTDLIETIIKILEPYKAVVLSTPESIAAFLHPDDKVKQNIWLDGYGYAIMVFDKEYKQHLTISK